MTHYQKQFQRKIEFNEKIIEEIKEALHIVITLTISNEDIFRNLSCVESAGIFNLREKIIEVIEQENDWYREQMEELKEDK